MVRKGFSTILITSFIGLLTIFSISNPFLNHPQILSFEVTDQHSEGIFSSLSRNFDETLEEINSDNENQGSDDQDSSTNTANTNDESDDQDSSTNTANTNDDRLENFTLAFNPQNSSIEITNSTTATNFEVIELETNTI